MLFVTGMNQVPPATLDRRTTKGDDKMDDRERNETQAAGEREEVVARPGDPNAEAPPPSKTSWGYTWGCLGLMVIFAVIIAIVYAIGYR